MRKHLILVVKGMAYGMTHVVPAIGGGTILILLGIYEQFVDACGNFLNWKRRREIIPFLLALLAGMAIGMVALSKLINYLLDHYEAPMMFFFIGLLLGTIPAILAMHGDMRFTIGRAIAFLFGVAAAVLLSILRLTSESALTGAFREIKDTTSFVYYVLTSFLAGAASVTPGMDGTLVFMLAGTYKPITAALSALSHLDIHWMTIIATALGAAPGIILFSKLIDMAIKRAPAVVYYCVLGVIVGSVYGLWPQTIGSASLGMIIVSGVAAIAGLVLALAFNRPNKARETGQ